MLHVVRLLAPTAYLPSKRQGAVQTGVVKTTALLSDTVRSTVISGYLEGMAPYERINDVDYCRIKLETPFYLRVFGCEQRIYYLAAAKVINEIKPDIVHIHNRPAFVPLIRSRIGKNIKVILHEHNHNLRDMFSDRKARRVLSCCDHVIEISEFSKQYDIADRFPEFLQKVSVVNRGVDEREFRPYWERIELRAQLRERFGVQDNKVIMFSGALRDIKGIHHLVDAMEHVLKRHDDTVLYIAGGSWKNIDASDSFSRQVFARSKKYGDRVIVGGFVPYEQMHEMYLMADVFCGPSVWDEPFGLVFVEAMASGLPVVSTRRGGIPEIVVDGETGFLVDDPSDTRDLAGKLCSLLDDSDLRRRMGEQGRKRAEEHFSWRNSAQGLLRVYHNLTSQAA